MRKTEDQSSIASGPAPQYPIESVDNALRVLLLLGERNELRLTEVANHLGVATSTAHRLLAMLTYRGFIRQAERGKSYVPGTALTSVAFSILQRFDVRQALHPSLERLHAELQETVHLGVLDGTTVRFVDALESQRAVRVASRLGQSMPAHCTSTGKVLLAQLPDDELRRRYPDEELQQLTPNSVATRAELEKEVELARRLGYATSSEESEEGVSSIAVALPAKGAPIQVAFNVAAPIGRMNHAEQRRISSVLRDVAKEAAGVLH
ncbi:IclR family transcriptional regulator [Streptomyces coeruleorubidus]|uniref:IclR family transcriptional regulator n=1 Tax=Streptomyces coeruleorubidus TaxID=116188 RepID=UPI0036F5BBBD